MAGRVWPIPCASSGHALAAAALMAAPDTLARCSGPDDEHAFDVIPMLPRPEGMDRECPLCRGHGQWNAEIDLATFRSVRAICPRCGGAGWIDADRGCVEEQDIVRAPGGEARWLKRLVPAHH